MDFLLEQFIEEAREQLNFLDENIEYLENKEPELLNSVFRAAHTLKGGAGIVGFDAVKNITHKAEDLLAYLRDDKIDFQDSIVSVLYETFDEVTTLIDAAYEEGRIITGDEERILQIKQALTQEIEKGQNIKNKNSEKNIKNNQKNRSLEQSQNLATLWRPPFKIGDKKSKLFLSDIDFLDILNIKLEFKTVLNEKNIDDNRIYGIEFDVDEKCMVYGNDPLYALSLFEDQLLSIVCCMPQDKSKFILSGIDNEDGLTLTIRMVAFVNSTWNEIESNLFNFIDDIILYPVDIESLLFIEGRREEIPPLKDLYNGIQTFIQNGNTKDIKIHILNMIPLISQSSLQAKILNRLLHVLDDVSPTNLKKLDLLLKDLYKSSNIPEVINNNVVNKDLTDEEKEILEDILYQQKYQLNNFSTNEIKERVQIFLEHMEWILPRTIPDDFTSVQELKHFIKVLINPDEEDEEFSEEENKKKENKKEENKKEENKKEENKKEENKKEENKKEEIIFDDDTLIGDDGVVENYLQKEKPKKVKDIHIDSKYKLSKMVKVEQDTIDRLMNLVGELLVAKNSLPYLVDSLNSMNKDEIRRGIIEKYTAINRLSSQLQDLSMSMRMLPISYIFDRYPRLVRDMSKKLEKKVKLVVDGKDTKLDKNMIEVLAEPLLHVMRNSLDHGIETIKTRIEKGKPEEGIISIRAFPQSDKIVIEVQDDGKGIEVEKVINKVLERDLMPIEEIEKLSNTEKLNLIFLPGLSTSDETSEYSGRGVGMDAVNKAINTFGGTIEIESIPNEKTTIRLSIPSSLAVTALLHVSMNHVHYGFPMDSVSETVKIEAKEIRYLHNEPFIYIRGEVIPLIIIQDMLDMTNLKKKTLSIVVLNIKGNLLAVIVNELLGQLDVVQKPFDGILEKHPLLSGTALLGNGQIIMSIDPVGLFALANQIKINKL